MIDQITPLVDTDCVWCDRVCPRCRYDIRGGWEHIEQKQPEGASHVVCSLKRVVRPLVEAITLYLDHKQHRGPEEAMRDAIYDLFLWMAFGWLQRVSP